MKKPILLIALCLLLPVVIYWSIYPQIRPITVLCLGDSITMGVGGTHGGYRGYLKQMLGERYQFITEAHKGWRSDQILQFLPHTLLEVKPDIVLLLIGANDIAQGVPIENIALNNMYIWNMLRDANPKTKIFFYCLTGEDVLANNLTTVDMSYIFKNEALIVDKYHPNDQGYEQIAKEWYKAIRR